VASEFVVLLEVPVVVVEVVSEFEVVVIEVPLVVSVVESDESSIDVVSLDGFEDVTSPDDKEDVHDVNNSNVNALITQILLFLIMCP